MSLKYVKWWQIYYSLNNVIQKILLVLYAIHCTSLNECATHLLLRIFMTAARLYKVTVTKLHWGTKKVDILTRSSANHIIFDIDFG